MLWHPCLPASTASETLPGGPPCSLPRTQMDSVEGSSAEPCLQDASAMPRLTPTRGGLRRSCWRRRRGLHKGERRPSLAARRASAKRGAPRKSTGVMASAEELQLQSTLKVQEKSSNMETSEEEPKECEEGEEEGVYEEGREGEEEEEEEEGGDGEEGEEEEAEEEGEGEEEGEEEEEERLRSCKKEDSKGESGLIGARKRKSNKVMKREVEPRSESAEDEGKSEEVRYVCPICEDVLSSQHLFTVHIRSHNAAESSSGGGSPGGSKAFSCRICGKALSSSSSLDRHMLVHSGERPFKCKLCGVAFTTNGNMHRHMRTHTATSSKEAEEISDGGSSDSGGSKRGKTPGRKRQVEGVKSRRKGKETGWRCLTCDLSFTNQRELRLHAYMTHREMEAEEEDDDEEVEEEERGRKRSRRAEGTPTMGFRDLTFVDFSTSKFPLIAKAACEKSVHRASSEYHRFQCGRCDRAFPCGSALHIHADSLHRSTSPAAPLADPKEDFFAVLNLQNKKCCPSPPPALRILRQNSPSLSHLPHAERKRREEEFDNAFYFNATKDARLAEENGGEASEAPKDLADISSIISAVASNASGLMRSVEEEEGSEEEEEEQEEEDATFAAELREMKSRGEFPCKLCPSVFPNLRALKGHGRYHVAEVAEGSPSEEERHPCCLCGRRVAKHALARHLRSHNGERPFRCALCRYAFTTKANCERHLRNRHSKASREEVRRSVIYSPVGDEPAEGETETKIHDSHIPSKLSTLLTVISDPKHGVESIGKLTGRTEEKTKFSDEEEELRCRGRMDDLSSVEALVNFAKSPSLPLSVMNVQIPLQQNVFRPIAVKREGGNEGEGAEVPLDLSMDALDLSNKKTQDEPEDLSRPSVGKARPNVAVPVAVAFDGSQLMPPRMPAVTRPMTQPVLPENPLISLMPKMDTTPAVLSNGSAPVEAARPPSSSFYPGPLQMYLNPQFPISASTRPSIGNFPYLLPLPFPASSSTLISQLPSAHSPSLRTQSLMSPPATQSLPSHTPTPPFPRQATPSSATPPSMERLEKEILRNLQLSSGGSLVLDPASVADRIQAIAMAAAAAAAGFPSPATTSEHPPQSMASQAKDLKPNDQPVAAMGEVTPSKEDPRMQPGVKMVIKNGVLMPKQKQRRYRTERPFACCHCSARFTLRSNMERHIKQQHPEFWSQRPRGGRRGGSSGLSAPSRTDESPSAADARLSNSPDGPLPPAASLPAESAGKPSSEDGCSDYRDDDTNMDESENNNTDSIMEDRVSICESSTNLDDPNEKAKDSNKTVISEEVKNAIAQQLKSKLIADCRSAFSPSVRSDEAKVINAKEEVRKGAKNFKEESNADEEDDSGELVIDEEKVDMETECSANRGGNSITKEDESSGVDLASVSKLLDNASTQTFQQYFKSEEDDEADERRRGGEGRGGDEGYDGGADGEDEEEEEGWKSGDESGGSKEASSGEEERAERDDSLERKLASVTVEAATAADTEDKGKRRSAYSSAPNRVSCPYCMRKFPWRSSLRRHILTHTGQKPYKCAHCPLLFTTKSNCDRHLLRKHGKGSGGSSSGAEDTVSVMSSSGGGAVSPGGAYAMRNVPERPYKCSVCPSSTFSTQNNLKKHLATKHQQLQLPNNSGRCSTSPRGGSDKAGSISSAGSPRCATEERDIDDEEDEEGLVGAEDEEGVLEEEEEGEEGSGGEGDRVVRRKKNNSERNSEEVSEVQRREQVNGDEHSKPKEHHNVHNHQAAPHQHLHHQHHHHHPGSDLPFKCHLCERSYAERTDALNHIRDSHTSEYELLVAKGALDSAVAVSSEDSHLNNNHGSAYHNNNHISGLDQMGGEENLEQLRGKFPDYANRKVVCAFCMRRFWSAEDLRRHMRTHTGERPFSCDICARRFTLKHSMLRHRKKHSSAERASLGGNPMAAVTSEASGDEEGSTNKHRDAPSTNWQHTKEEEEKDSKRRKLCPQEIGLKSSGRGVAAALGSATGDLIGNLLGIQDGSIIDKMLLSKSANDAAKLLGVEGHD